MTNSITVLLEAHNEEKHISDCIASAKLLTDSIIVVDMRSTDNTVELAKKNGAEVISFPSHPHYVEPAREFGIRLVKTDWVMILDADERITKTLVFEIKHAIKSKEFSHYKIPRKNYFGGKQWLQHGGWWPDPQMRLINVKFFKLWPSDIHSTPIIEGKMGHLEEPFLHFFHGDVGQMVNKTIMFEDIESELLYRAGRPVSTPIFFRKFGGELWRRLVKGQGYKDGTVGIMESMYQAFSKTITYLFLYEKKNSRSL